MTDVGEHTLGDVFEPVTSLIVVSVSELRHHPSRSGSVQRLETRLTDAGGAALVFHANGSHIGTGRTERSVRRFTTTERRSVSGCRLL